MDEEERDKIAHDDLNIMSASRTGTKKLPDPMADTLANPMADTLADSMAKKLV